MSYTLNTQELIDGVYYKREDFFKYYIQDQSVIPSNLVLWGYNNLGQLGNGFTVNSASVVKVRGGGLNWDKLFCGDGTTFALKTDGTLWGWGDDTLGALGDSDASGGWHHKSSPVQIGIGTDWKNIFAGMRNTLGLKLDGSLWSWGDNNNGMLGLNDIDPRSFPIQVGTDTNWKEINVGYYHSAAIKQDGTLWLWGSGSSGVLGRNDEESQSSPVQTICGGTNWKQIGCGWSHTIALKTDGTLWTWGDNWGGQLGNGTFDLVSSPIQTLAGGTNWSSISAGDNQSAAIKTDGSLWMWGAGWGGCLGNNLQDDTPSPIETIAGGNNWLKVNCNDCWTMASKQDGTLWAWGGNWAGSIGDGTFIDRSSPVQILIGYNWIDFAKANHIHTGVILIPE